MQRLKEFVGYTKDILEVRDTLSLVMNMRHVGINESLMVENSGIAVSNFLLKTYGKSKILFICGSGGKGATGLAAARHLVDYVKDVSVAFVVGGKIKNDVTELNYDILSNIQDISMITDQNILEIRDMIKHADVIVDSIMSIGMSGLLSALVSQIINEINRSNKKIVSIDVPTGTNADTGLPNRRSVNSDVILSLQKNKAGIAKDKSLSKKAEVLDIHLPREMELLAGPGDVMLATHPRLKGSNKYTSGSVLIMGGSKRYKGAPIMSAFAADSALAAMRVGTGYVTVFSPADSASEIIKAAPNLIVNPLDKGVDDDDISNIMKTRHNVMVIGPGMDPGFISSDALGTLMKKEKSKGNTVIVDAGAMKSILDNGLVSDNMVFTPHHGEFKKLAGIDLRNASLEKRIRVAIDFSKSHKCTIVLKGNETIITNGKLLKINRSATSALATMGTGDVLDGMIAGYSATHPNIFESSVAAVYVHSKIGDLLSKSMGNHIIAQDLITEIPHMLKSFDVIR